MPVFTFSSVVRGYHVYKDIWTADLGEVLPCVRQPTNRHDPHAVAISKDGTIVGHVPKRISAACSLFMIHGGTISCQVDGSRRQYSWDLPQGGMEIPCILTFTAGEQFLLERTKRVVKDVSEMFVEVGTDPEIHIEDDTDPEIHVEDDTDPEIHVEDDTDSGSPKPKIAKLDPTAETGLDDTWVCLDARRAVLKMSERELILHNKKLNDLIINFAQFLLKSQFSSLNGLFSTLLLSTMSPFSGWQENFVQICHCQSLDHWITVSTKGCSDGEVMIYDSSYGVINPVVASSLERLFNTPLTFKMAVVGKQEGGIDCGVLAIANATAIAFRDCVTPLPKFDQSKIRPYLALCFEIKSFSEFPEIYL